MELFIVFKIKITNDKQKIQMKSKINDIQIIYLKQKI